MMDQDKSESAKTEELRQQVVIQAERIDALAAENAKLRQENERLTSSIQESGANEECRAEANLSMLRRTHGL